MSKNVLFQELNGMLFKEKGIQLIIKREDLFFPEIPGNKWRKLKYNLEYVSKSGYSRILSFGGAYSNHLAALAKAGSIFEIPTIGLVRGEAPKQYNSTLLAAQKNGMQLQFVNRKSYREYTQHQVWDSLRKQFPNAYIIPEGGTNMLALKGCAEIIDDITSPYDYLCCPAGTGGTVSGIICGLAGKKKVLSFSALKGDFLEKEINQLVQEQANTVYTNYSLMTNYHFGGYAKFDKELLDFIISFYQKYNIPLDPIYTGKMMFGIFDLVAQDYFKPGSRIIAIHTGGLQGVDGFNKRHGTNLPC